MKSQLLPSAIAVVDDDESVRSATASLLRSCGWSVQTFSSGYELLAEIDEGNDICLVITDLQMPGIDGFSLCAKLAERGTNIQVIFVTAFATPDMVRKASGTTAIDFFTKPFDDIAFLARVAESVDTVWRARELTASSSLMSQRF
jgi:FixJ family two-component response regulator